MKTFVKNLFEESRKSKLNKGPSINDVTIFTGGKGHKLRGEMGHPRKGGPRKNVKRLGKTGDTIYGWPLIRFLYLLLELKSH